VLVPNVDPFSAFEQAIRTGLCVGAVVVVCYVFARRKWARKRGFRGSCSHVGLALQQLQAIACPQVEYAIEEPSQEKQDEDEGGPDDPTQYYRRLGERIDREHRRRTPEGDDGSTHAAEGHIKPEED
jgi:hypothetical protein